MQREAERASSYATDEAKAADLAKADRLKAEIALERVKMDCEVAERALDGVQRDKEACEASVEDLRIEMGKLSIEVRVFMYVCMRT